MSLEDYLQTLQEDAVWDSSGKFSIDRKSAMAKLRKYSFPRRAQWALKVVQHAVSTGARRVQICDEGEGIDESVGLSFRYDSEEPSPDKIESGFSVLHQREGPSLSIDHLTYVLLGALKSSGRFWSRPYYARFSARSGGRWCNLDLLSGMIEWREGAETRWTYDLYIERQRPLFTYSFLGHPEFRELRSACSYCPIEVTINGSPLVEAADGFLRAPILLCADSRRISASAALAGNPVWVPQAHEPVPMANQVAIPRCQTGPNGRLALPGVEFENGRLESHFYEPAQGSAKSSIIPVIDGVSMKPVALEHRLRYRGDEAEGIPFTALVGGAGLRVDQSHGRVVEDARWQAVVEEVKEEAAKFSLALKAWLENQRGPQCRSEPASSVAHSDDRPTKWDVTTWPFSKLKNCP